MKKFSIFVFGLAILFLFGCVFLFPRDQEVEKPKRKTAVLVYYFFTPDQEESIEMVSDMERIYQESLIDTSIKFKAFSFVPMVAEEVSLFQKRTGATFPVRDGRGMAGAFLLDKSPSMILIDVRNVKSQFIEGEVVDYNEIQSRIEKIKLQQKLSQNQMK